MKSLSSLSLRWSGGWSRFFSCAALAALAPLGCKSNSADSTTVSAFCVQWATQECNTAFTLCLIPDDTCLTAREAVCAQFTAANTTATRVFHPEKTSTCIDEVKDAYQKPTITPSDLDAIQNVCARVFTADLMALAPCTSDYDCSGTLVCDKGFCASKVQVSAGALCSNPGEICQTGFYCTGTPLTCMAKQTQGAACDPVTAPCLETLRCDGATNTCQPRATAVEACQSDADCVSAAPYCDPNVGNLCSVGLRFAPQSADCRPYGGTGTITGTGGTSGAGGSGVGSADASTAAGGAGGAGGAE